MVVSFPPPEGAAGRRSAHRQTRDDSGRWGPGGMAFRETPTAYAAQWDGVGQPPMMNITRSGRPGSRIRAPARAPYGPGSRAVRARLAGAAGRWPARSCAALRTRTGGGSGACSGSGSGAVRATPPGVGPPGVTPRGVGPPGTGPTRPARAAHRPGRRWLTGRRLRRPAGQGLRRRTGRGPRWLTGPGLRRLTARSPGPGRWTGRPRRRGVRLRGWSSSRRRSPSHSGPGAGRG